MSQFGLLLQISHHMNVTSFWSIVAECMHSFISNLPSSNGDNMIMHHVMNQKSDCFINMTIICVFCVSLLLDLNLIGYLWDVLQQEFRSMTMHPNLEDLHNIIMSVWTRITKE